MSDGGPFDGFDGAPMWQAFAHILGSNPGQGWEVAKQVAHAAATAGETEPNVDPSERSRWEDLAPIAAQRVLEVTALDQPAPRLEVLNRGTWAARAVDAYRPILERVDLMSGLVTDGDDDTSTDLSALDPTDPMGGLDALAQAMQPLMRMLGPTLMGAQAGAVIGQLARSALGAYDVAVPWPAGSGVAVIAPNVSEFVSDWSLDSDDARMWVLIDQHVRHSVLSVPHVRKILLELLEARAATVRLDPSALEDQLGDIDLSNPRSISMAGLEPSAMLVRDSSANPQAAQRLDALLVALVGYVNLVHREVAERVLGAKASSLTEASHRRVVAATASDRLASLLLGVDDDRTLHDRGATWAKGVVERGGLEALNRLWASPRELPTPAEIEAPGLWLARIDLPDLD